MFGYRHRKAGVWMMAVGLALTTLLSGCGEIEEQEDPQIVVEKEQPTVEYTLVSVQRGDIVSTKRLKATYSQENFQQVSFEVGGKQISKVYVKKGDKVKKGDLLAELSGGGREAEIEALEYRIARNKLLLSQIDDTENYEISRRWLQKIYNGSYETEGIPQLQKQNEYSREDYRDAIEIDEQVLAQVKKDVQQSRVYAQMDGTVCYIRNEDYLEGSTSVKDQVIMEIMDSSKCFFAVTDMKYAQYVQPDGILTVTITTGTNAGKYQVEPYRMDEWTDVMYFSLLDDVELEAGTDAMILIELDKRENVLTLLELAVRNAGDKHYVYIAKEDGSREVRWVELGLQTNEVVEILSGLEEGEKVVLR